MKSYPDFLCFLLGTLNQLCYPFCCIFWNILLFLFFFLLTLIPREIFSLSSWTQRASIGNLAGESPATDWYNYLGRAILPLKWRLFWHFPVQLKLFLKLHGLNKTGSPIKNDTCCWTLSFTNTYI